MGSIRTKRCGSNVLVLLRCWHPLQYPNNLPFRSCYPSARATQALVQSLLPKTKYADSLPAATARSCLPHWLEAAGWAAALMSDAAAAAMGRLPSTWREGLPVHVLQGVGCRPPANDVG